VILPVLGHLAAWQLVLLATGAPCLLISWLVFTIYEPKRRQVKAEGASIADAAAFMGTRVRFFVGHFIGIGLMSMCGYGMVAWLPTYLHRHFGTPMAEVGVILGISQAITGAVSALFMGLPVDLWYQRGRADAHLRFLILCAFVQIAAVVCVVAAPSLPLCIAFVCVYTLTSPFMGPAVAALQIVTPPEFRGRVSSVYLMVFNILGIGCGPSAVGFLTTFVFKSDAMVGWAMVTAHFILMPFCLFFLALALRPLREAAASGIAA
jgi:hypothetical protein